MKSKVVLVGLFLFLTILIDAQVLSYPSYKGRSNHSMNIVKVKKTKKGLELEMKHHAPEAYEKGGWIYIGGLIKLIDKKNNLSYKLISFTGIDTLESNRHFYSKVGDSLIFTLVFEPLKKETKFVDVVECESKNCFNFYDLNVTKKESVIFESDSVMEYIPNVTYNNEKTSAGFNKFRFLNNDFYGFEMTKGDGTTETFKATDKAVFSIGYNGSSTMEYPVKGDKGSEFVFQMVSHDLIIFFYADKAYEFRRKK